MDNKEMLTISRENAPVRDRYRVVLVVAIVIH